MPNQEFGQRLRELRKAKGLTKEALCDDESKLSVRQLTRLESGQSQPTLRTLEYLSERLGTGLTELIGQENMDDLPAEYQKLKYQLIRTPIYGSQEVLAELENQLDVIFDNYYDNLPSEEQLAVDILQSYLYTYENDGKPFGKEIFDRNEKRLRQKKFYDVNDLLILRLYQMYIDEKEVVSGKFDMDLFDDLAVGLLNSKDHIPSNYAFLLRDILIMVPTVEIFRCRFAHTNKAFQRLNEIMTSTQDYQKEPIIKMLEWKYSLVKEKNIDKARKLYEDALTLAKLFQNENLTRQLQHEWEKNLEEYTYK
ncbi:helix-turn-helix domain-containing protein [Streptococcus cristatus]|uniref:Transcriptional regulator n=1 Tax=Streptococcus cristatus TaxID=45634 RepID=A0A139MWX0_STRCR|nr:XRE family transcriptional regulator [Streptococcus cristatus]KXT68276.1 Transcriptional regulator [Streptococcus cristatus]